jgi:hypothetical protein
MQASIAPHLLRLLLLGALSFLLLVAKLAAAVAEARLAGTPFLQQRWLLHRLLPHKSRLAAV